MAIIGDGDSILAFKAVGVEAFPVKDVKDAESTLKKLVKDYKIIFVTENIAIGLDAIIKRYLSEPYPIIIPVPGEEGTNGYGLNGIKRAMDKALGVDIFIDDRK